VLVRRLRAPLPRHRFDVLHVHDPFAPLPSPAALALAPCPVVVTWHAGGSPLAALGGLLFRPLLGRISHRLAVSDEARRLAERHLGGPVEVLPNGVELPQEFSLDGRRDRIVFVGRPDPRKGLHVLLRAWPEIRRRTGVRLRLVGPRPEDVAALAGAGDGIDVLGPLGADGVGAELATARLLVAPSLGQESFGMVLTQAFAHATPVVASRIPGYVEVVDEETGVLVPRGEPQVLAREVVALLGDEARRRALAGAGRRAAEERWDWLRIARRLVEIYAGARAGEGVAVR
jgi:phosphatidyl-myo-inositol alpha-mannosyltransferase